MKKRLPLILVFIASIILLLLNTHQAFLPKPKQEKVNHPKLGYSWQIFDSSSWQINKTSPTKEQTFLVAKAIHYQDKTQVSRFTKPFSIRQTPKTLLLIQSNKGRSEQDAILHLSGKVTIHRVSDNGQENKTLKTEKITYNSKKQTLFSPVFTELTDAKLIISGTGFSANLKQNQYQFKSNVKTLYTPEKAKHETP